MRRPKGQKRKKCAGVFWGCWPQPFLAFCVSFFLQKHCFPPENRLFCSFLSVSLFFPWLLSLFLFHSLSLSFLFLVFCFLPCFLVFFVLPCFCCSFLPCFFAFVLRIKNNIKFSFFVKEAIFRLFSTLCFKKHYYKIGLLRVPSFQQHQKTCFTNCKLVCHTKCIKNSVLVHFCSKTTIFVRQSGFWKKCMFLCPVFWGKH